MRRRITKRKTTIGVVLTSNLGLVEAPGNVLVPKRQSGLPKDSVANVSQIVTIDRAALIESPGRLSGDLMEAVDVGVRLALAL